MKITAAAIALTMTLGASGAANAGERRSGVVRNPTVNSVKQPVVHRTDYIIDLAGGGSGVPDAELYRLAQWFENLELGYGDKIYVDAGYDTQRARADVGKVAGEFGLLVNSGAPVTGGAIGPGSVRVVVSRSEATVPNCPDWSDNNEFGERISTASNYGCSVNTNLARMIADPNDLVLGQVRNGVSDPLETTRVITSYRNRAPTGFQDLKSEKGK
jgi:pilus assembly protein CpaD